MKLLLRNARLVDPSAGVDGPRDVCDPWLRGDQYAGVRRTGNGRRASVSSRNPSPLASVIW